MIEIIPSSVTDQEIVTEFKESRPWGIEALINISDCNEHLIKDPEFVKQFIIDLCEFIDMKRYGEPIVERFGSGNLLGISFVQLIHTSCIVGHISEETKTVYLDIFSCKSYKPKETAEFAMNYFKGKSVELKTILRD